MVEKVEGSSEGSDQEIFDRSIEGNPQRKVPNPQSRAFSQYIGNRWGFWPDLNPWPDGGPMSGAETSDESQS